MNRRTLWFTGVGLVSAFLLIVVLSFLLGSSDYYETKRFQRAFSHPLFLAKKHSNFFAQYDIGRERKVSAQYPLTPDIFEAVKEQNVIDPFENGNAMLVIKFDGTKGKWYFQDGPEVDGELDRVNGYKFANLPKKVQKKLMKKFRKARKYLIKNLEREISVYFDLKKPKN